MAATKAYLGLGTNLGNRIENLKRAVSALETTEGVHALRLSWVYETAPWGPVEQPDFLNMAVAITTDLPPAALLDRVKQIEQELGREESERWGPRLIDVDVLFYGDRVVNDGGLQIPHRRLEERAFVLAPMADLAPDLVHPQSGHTVREMLSAHPRDAVRRLPLPLLWGRRTYVMGILNVTPDSFSGDGLMQEEAWLQAAVAQARRFVEEGADVLDVGGESTRPGSEPITAEAELQRVIPVVQALRQALDVPLSVDTYRAAVARAALDAGADWVNDVWGLRMDPDMAPLVAQAGCPVVIMHNRSKPKNVEQEQRLGGRYVGIEYDDLIADVSCELEESIDLALSRGVDARNILVDPGIGFGKTVSQNLQLIDQLHRFKELGYPLLIGTSRKSFIGYTLDLPPEERMEGTAATVSIGIDRGADVVRVHDVKPMVRLARMTDRIVRQR